MNMREDKTGKLNVQLEDCKGKWVALNEDESRILGIADDIRSAVDQAHEKGIEKPLIIKVPTTSVRSYFF